MTEPTKEIEDAIVDKALAKVRNRVAPAPGVCPRCDHRDGVDENGRCKGKALMCRCQCRCVFPPAPEQKPAVLRSFEEGGVFAPYPTATGSAIAYEQEQARRAAAPAPAPQELELRKLYAAACRAQLRSTEGRTFEEWRDKVSDYGLGDARQALESETAVALQLAECVWTMTPYQENEYWETDCGEAFVFEVDGPTENKMKFCCYCSKPLKAVIKGSEL